MRCSASPAAGVHRLGGDGADSGARCKHAFNGFPVLGSILARDGYLPRQLHTRGDRLAFSNGIIALSATAMLLIYIFDADVSKLIQLYIVGVFVSFTMSQTGMVRHWTRLLRTEQDPALRARMVRSRVINSVGLLLTGSVLVIVLLTKFTRGAYLAILAMAALFLLMKAISRHYASVAEELKADTTVEMLPSRIHAVVLVSKLHKPALRALAYARASRPASLEALTVSVDPAETDALLAEWERAQVPVPLKVLDSPFREVTRPDRRLRQVETTGQPARHRRCVCSRVRRRSMVGGAAAQPECFATEDSAPLYSRGRCGVGAVPAALLTSCRGPAGELRSGSGSPWRANGRGCRADSF